MNVVVLLCLCAMALAEDTGQPAGLMAHCEILLLFYVFNYISSVLMMKNPSET